MTGIKILHLFTVELNPDFVPAKICLQTAPLESRCGTLAAKMGGVAKSRNRAGQVGQRQKLVEEFAVLDREIENYLPRIHRHEQIRRLILDWHKSLPPEEAVTIPGLTCDILITAQDSIRTVTPKGKEKLYKLWGQKGFIAKAHMFLKVLPDPRDEKGLYTEKAPTGPRHLHVMQRPAASSAA